MPIRNELITVSDVPVMLLGGGTASEKVKAFFHIPDDKTIYVGGPQVTVDNGMPWTGDKDFEGGPGDVLFAVAKEEVEIRVLRPRG